jgi:hypothetical protein
MNSTDGEVALKTYTIYQNPLDYPGKFVVRAWLIIAGFPEPVPAETQGVTDSLEQARACIPAEMARIDRSPGDDLAIVETWVYNHGR